MNIFISGASAGIGAALAKIYSRENVNIFLIANSRIDLLADVSTACKLQNANIVYRSADVRSLSQMQKVAEEFFNLFGRIDIVIANAGIAESSDGITPEILLARNNMETNYFGVINTVEAFLPSMKEQRSGHIVIISSIASKLVTRRSGAYSASKSAINSWANALRLQVKHNKIFVSVLNPGFVKTSMTEGNSHFMPGLISAEVAALKIKKLVDRKVRVKSFPLVAKLIIIVIQFLPKKIYESVFLILEGYIGDQKFRKKTM